jgi:replicative DNA helicase
VTDRLPPTNIEAEKCVLGCMLLDNATIDEISLRLRPDDFYRDAHQTLYAAILTLHASGTPADPMTLEESLLRACRLSDVGGDRAIVEMLQAPPHAGNACYYATIVHEKAVSRRLIEQANATIRECYSNTYTADELREMAESRIYAIGDERCSGHVRSSLDGLDEFDLKLTRRMDGEVTGLPSGIRVLDELTGGFQPGSLTVVGARPSMGKSALMLNIVDHVAVDLGVPAFFVSMEMSRSDLVERMVCTRAEVDSRLVRNASVLQDHQIARVNEAVRRFREAPFPIDDGGNQTASRIAANARRLKSRAGIGLVVVDYLQLVEGESDGPRASRQEQVAAISRRLKQMAMDLDLPVIAVSQLNRQAEAREDHRPRMSDLRESGSIEQDADTVMLLHRPDYYDENDHPGIAELDLAKNRNGAVGMVHLEFRKSITKFNSL